MKRGGELNRTGLKRSAPLERTAWKRAEGRGLSGRARVAPILRRSEPKHAGRKDTIPRKVRKLVNDRDPWCLMSGSPSGLEMHHRRPKQMGGDPRPHADCCCNLVRLSAEQHKWVHRNRSEAEAMGLLLPAETVLPGSVSVMRASEDGRVASYPSCEGQWLSEPPCEVAA